MNRYIRLISTFSLGVALTLSLASKAPAAKLAPSIGSTSTGGNDDPNSFITIGFEFRALSNILIKSLGVYTQGDSQNPVRPSQIDVDVARPVGLWRVSDRSLLGQIIVQPGGNQCQNDFCFADLPTLVELKAGEDYRIGVYYADAKPGDKLQNTTLTNIDPKINLVVNRFFASNFSDQLKYPDQEVPNSFTTSANVIIITEVPESSAVGALFLLVLGGYLFKKQ
ncbi:hypothetical protein [Aphanothece sacrum]|uniref:Leucyl-tRNA synthetase n=1 Tax=Aphanothece sacrum FPU1 TaxID=1920663 RepID=A0A401IHP9_APHSA|nr:hypothetical protein [Aphanothece sacrum]GBF80774.1 leucyl-tRNA synthetase [Aphanothece sacrum FPU1]GBF83269.1 leucyl-tRNA synthetase [Aphanothece sacrum FPU3]